MSKDSYYPLSPPLPQGFAIVHPLTSKALVLVSSGVCTSSTLSNMFPVDVTSSRSRVSKDSYYPLPPPPRPPPPRSCYHSSLTSKALVLVSSGVFTSSTLSNIFPVDVASSRSRVSKDNYYLLPLSPPPTPKVLLSFIPSPPTPWSWCPRESAPAPHCPTCSP